MVRKERRTLELHWLFHAFPAGRSGLGLMLLRLMIGIVLVTSAGADLLERSDRELPGCISVLLAFLSGILLMVGLATPVAGFIAALKAAGMLFPAVAAGGSGLQASETVWLMLSVSSAAVVLLGPGAFSLDAHLFGWREVIIPPRPPDDTASGPGCEKRGVEG